MESAVLTAGAGGPQNNVALKERDGEMTGAGSLMKRTLLFLPGSSEAVLDSPEPFRYHLASSQSGGAHCVAEIELGNPPATLRSLGGEPFGRRDYHRQIGIIYSARKYRKVSKSLAGLSQQPIRVTPFVSLMGVRSGFRVQHAPR